MDIQHDKDVMWFVFSIHLWGQNMKQHGVNSDLELDHDNGI